MQKIEEHIEVLRTAYEYINKLTQGTLEAAEYFHSGQEDKGFQSVSLIADGILWLVGAIELTRRVQKQEIKTEGIMAKINEINEAMQKNDTVLIADLLEFEIVPVFQQWQLGIQKSIGLALV